MNTHNSRYKVFFLLQTSPSCQVLESNDSPETLPHSYRTLKRLLVPAEPSRVHPTGSVAPPKSKGKKRRPKTCQVCQIIWSNLFSCLNLNTYI